MIPFEKNETDDRPIEIGHARPDRANYLYVDWTMGNTCNYDCSYCPKSLHDGSIGWHSDDTVLEFSKILLAEAAARGKRIHIQFTGGEVSLRPKFLNLLGLLHQEGCSLGLISNGSRTPRWWRNASPLLDNVVLTFHPERAELVEFGTIARIAGDLTKTHINVTAPPARFDQAVAAAEYLATTCQNVSIILKPMLLDFGSKLYPYNDAQRQILAERRFTAPQTRSQNAIRGDLSITYESGRKERVRPAELLVANRNRWNGWECDAGLELLAVAMDGSVYRGLCREGGLLGSIFRPSEFRQPSEPVICGKASCTCLLDVMVSRRDLANPHRVPNGSSN